MLAEQCQKSHSPAAPEHNTLNMVTREEWLPERNGYQRGMVT